VVWWWRILVLSPHIDLSDTHTPKHNKKAYHNFAIERRMLCILRESNLSAFVSDDQVISEEVVLTRANCLEGNYPTVGPRMPDEGFFRTKTI
jgi:hypothetical protein